MTGRIGPGDYAQPQVKPRKVRVHRHREPRRHTLPLPPICTVFARWRPLTPSSGGPAVLLAPLGLRQRGSYRGSPQTTS